MRDYYVILGVPSDANKQQIQAAYRKQVKELHPDYFGENSDPFLELQRAYSVLRDPALRRAYDKELVQQRMHYVPVAEWLTNAPYDRPPIEPLNRRSQPGIVEVTPPAAIVEIINRGEDLPLYEVFGWR